MVRFNVYGRRAAVAVAATILLCGTARAQQPGASNAAATQAASRTAAYMESIRNDPARLTLFLRDMPKGGDLHNHMSGAIYAESYLKWAAQDGLCLNVHNAALSAPPCVSANGNVPADSAYRSTALYAQTIDAWSMRHWDAARKNGHDQFFDTFGKFFPAATSPHTADMIAEAASRAAADRVSYLELLWTPDDPTFGGIARADALEPDFLRLRDRLLQAGLADRVAGLSRSLDTTFQHADRIMHCDRAQNAGGTGSGVRPDAGCDVEVRILYQVLRAFPPEMVFAQILAGFEMAAKDPRVVGLNLVQPEDDPVAMRDYSLHMRMIAALRPLYPNVQLTLHAGELVPGLVPPEGLRFHIREAIRVAGATRIGHGIDIAYEDSAVSVLQEMARRNILVEINLTSNDVILGVVGREHPLHLYMRYNVPVALSTDDEGVSRSDMTLEYRRAVTEQGLHYDELKKMAMNSIRYSFADDVTRKRLLDRLARAFAAFEQRTAAAR